MKILFLKEKSVVVRLIMDFGVMTQKMICGSFQKQK